MTAPTAARIPDAPESDLDLVVAAEKPVAQGVIRLSPPAGTGLSCRPGSPASTSTPTSPPTSSVSTRCDTTVVAGTVDHRDVLLTPPNGPRTTRCSSASPAPPDAVWFWTCKRTRPCIGGASYEGV